MWTCLCPERGKICCLCAGSGRKRPSFRSPSPALPPASETRLHQASSSPRECRPGTEWERAVDRKPFVAGCSPGSENRAPLAPRLHRPAEHPSAPCPLPLLSEQGGQCTGRRLRPAPPPGSPRPWPPRGAHPLQNGGFSLFCCHCFFLVLKLCVFTAHLANSGEPRTTLDAREAGITSALARGRGSSSQNSDAATPGQPGDTPRHVVAALRFGNGYPHVPTPNPLWLRLRHRSRAGETSPVLHAGFRGHVHMATEGAPEEGSAAACPGRRTRGRVPSAPIRTQERRRDDFNPKRRLGDRWARCPDDFWRPCVTASRCPRPGPLLRAPRLRTNHPQPLTCRTMGSCSGGLLFSTPMVSHTWNAVSCSAKKGLCWGTGRGA